MPHPQLFVHFYLIPDSTLFLQVIGLIFETLHLLVFGQSDGA
jgi:hypothetical protein